MNNADKKIQKKILLTQNQKEEIKKTAKQLGFKTVSEYVEFVLTDFINQVEKKEGD